MDLYKEILSTVIQRQDMVVVFPNLKINPTEIIELAPVGHTQA